MKPKTKQPSKKDKEFIEKLKTIAVKGNGESEKFRK